MLNFWEKDFEKSINKHIQFLKDNLENQDIYSSKFSEILEDMDIFKMMKSMKLKRKIKKKAKITPQMMIKIKKRKITKTK